VNSKRIKELLTQRGLYLAAARYQSELVRHAQRTKGPAGYIKGLKKLRRWNYRRYRALQKELYAAECQVAVAKRLLANSPVTWVENNLLNSRPKDGFWVVKDGGKSKTWVADAPLEQKLPQLLAVQVDRVAQAFVDMAERANRFDYSFHDQALRLIEALENPSTRGREVVTREDMERCFRKPISRPFFHDPLPGCPCPVCGPYGQ
jgi:hypothetical protein